MKRLIYLLLAIICCVVTFAENATKVGMKVYQKGGGVLDCGGVDSVNFCKASTRYDYVKDGVLIKASYAIGNGRRVYFSQGNLQFNATQGTHAVVGGEEEITGTWRFAENQYDYRGLLNAFASPTYDGWIDLFGWGTSGWSSGAIAYQPWSKSGSYTDYFPGGSDSTNLTGEYAKADWGVYNAISNGGNKPNKWRTLTISEWYNLIAYNKWTLGYINDGSESYLCFMLIPAPFTAPEGTTVTILSATHEIRWGQCTGLTVPSTNNYTTEQFASLEKLGVVALPCGGSHKYGSWDDGGFYWSSSSGDKPKFVPSFIFDSTQVRASGCSYAREVGLSVRLVQDY